MKILIYGGEEDGSPMVFQTSHGCKNVFNRWYIDTGVGFLEWSYIYG